MSVRVIKITAAEILLTATILKEDTSADVKRASSTYKGITSIVNFCPALLWWK